MESKASSVETETVGEACVYSRTGTGIGIGLEIHLT